LRGITAKTLLAVLLAAVGGCGLLPGATPPGKRVFVDYSQLALLPPGAPALREMDKEILSLAKLAGVEVTLPPIPVPPPTPMPAANSPLGKPGEVVQQAFASQAQQVEETHLTALREELAGARARNVERRKQELLAGLKPEMKVAQAQTRESQWQKEDAVFQRHRRALFNLQANLSRPQLTPKQKADFSSLLQAEEAAQANEIAGVRAATREELARVQQGKLEEIDKLLAAYEEELAGQDEALVTARKEKMRQSLEEAASHLAKSPLPEKAGAAPPPSPVELGKQITAQRAQAGAIVSESRQALLSRLDALRQARQRLGESLSKDIQAALEEVGGEQNLVFVFDAKEKGKLPNYTPQAKDWLKEYWRAADMPAVGQILNHEDTKPQRTADNK
jgi:hypothetical protein